METSLVAFGTLCALVGCSTCLSSANCDYQNGFCEPLYLTSYIESGKIEDGRKAAEVPPLLDNITSYSGYLTVNKQFGSNIFFWFFPAEETPETAPLTLRLQGRPGVSSMFAVFMENGAFYLDEHGKINRRSAYWSQKLNMIFIDQPVGTGFSFTQSAKGYAKNDDDASLDVHNALLQFLQLFPEYSNNEFYITGESYAGKYIPSVGYRIHRMNAKAIQKINMKGVAIGNGWVDSYNMIDYSSLLYGLDFIDLKTRDQFANIEEKIRTLIREGDNVQASSLIRNYIDEDTSLVNTVTGIKNWYNYLKMEYPVYDVLIGYLNSGEVRRHIHVGNSTFTGISDTVYRHLLPDYLVSAMTKLEALMNNYKVLLYSGQLDLTCAYSLTMNYVRKLKWKGAVEYSNAVRQQWFVGKDLAGYSKSAGNFTELLMHDAGLSGPSQ